MKGLLESMAVLQEGSGAIRGEVAHHLWRRRLRGFRGKRIAECFKSSLVVCRIAVVQEARITCVRAECFSRMLDGTKILLGTGHNLSNVGNQAITIGAISAMKFFNKIEIVELLSIKHDVVSTTNLGNAVNRKARRLIKTDG